MFDRDIEPAILEGNPKIYSMTYKGFVLLLPFHLSLCLLSLCADALIVVAVLSICVVSLHSGFFNARIFSLWLFYGLVQSVILFFIPISIWGTGEVVSNDSTGRNDGFLPLGIVVYTATVITVNLKIALLMTSWTWINHFALYISVILYFGFMVLFSLSSLFSLNGLDYYWLMFQCFKQPKYVLRCAVLCSAFCCAASRSPTFCRYGCAGTIWL